MASIGARLRFVIRPTVLRHEYYWQLVARNGAVVCESTRLFSTERKCRESIKLIRTNIAIAPVLLKDKY